MEIATFVAVDYKNIPDPRLDHFNKLFEIKLQMFENKFLEHKQELVQIINKLIFDNTPSLAKSSKPVQNQNVNKCTNNNINSKSWADSVNLTPSITSHVESHDEMTTDNDKNDDGYQEVRSKKSLKRKKTSTSTSPNNPNKKIPTPTIPVQAPTRIFGTGKTCTLKASKVIEERAAYYVGNVDSCTKDVMESYLKSNDIPFQYCFPLFRKQKSEEGIPKNKKDLTKETTTAFKIIVPKNQSLKLTNPEIWPTHSFFYEWDDNYSVNLQKNSKNNGRK